MDGQGGSRDKTQQAVGASFIRMALDRPLRKRRTPGAPRMYVLHSGALGTHRPKWELNA